MTYARRRVRRRGPRKPAEERKDYLIQARVPRELDDVLKKEAKRRRLSVSHLIRNVLEDTYKLVDGVIDEVDNLVQDSVRLTSRVQRDARQIARSATGFRGAAGRAAPDAGAPAAQRAAGTKQSANAEHASEVEHSPDAQHLPDVQRSPDAQHSSDAQRSPAQQSAAQHSPDAQRLANAQRSPDAQHSPDAHRSPDAQQSPDAQHSAAHSANAQRSPDAQRSAGPEARARASAARMPREPLPPSKLAAEERLVPEPGSAAQSGMHHAPETSASGPQPTAAAQTGLDFESRTADIYAWNPVVLHRAARCERCTTPLLRGDTAHLGLSETPTARPRWLCPACITEL